jgi:hypothetical protein
VRTDLVAAVRVGLPTESGPTELYAIGTGRVGHPWPPQPWQTDFGHTASLATLPR